MGARQSPPRCVCCCCCCCCFLDNAPLSRQQRRPLNNSTSSQNQFPMSAPRLFQSCSTAEPMSSSPFPLPIYTTNQTTRPFHHHTVDGFRFCGRGRRKQKEMWTGNTVMCAPTCGPGVLQVIITLTSLESTIRLAPGPHSCWRRKFPRGNYYFPPPTARTSTLLSKQMGVPWSAYTALLLLRTLIRHLGERERQSKFSKVHTEDC